MSQALQGFSIKYKTMKACQHPCSIQNPLNPSNIRGFEIIQRKVNFGYNQIIEYSGSYSLFTKYCLENGIEILETKCYPEILVKMPFLQKSSANTCLFEII